MSEYINIIEPDIFECMAVEGRMLETWSGLNFEGSRYRVSSVLSLSRIQIGFVYLRTLLFVTYTMQLIRSPTIIVISVHVLNVHRNNKQHID